VNIHVCYFPATYQLRVFCVLLFCLWLLAVGFLFCDLICDFGFLVFMVFCFWFFIFQFFSFLVFLIFCFFGLLTSLILKLRPHLTHYILPMYSHSDVEERDLGPPVTPLYTASHPNSSPASGYPNPDLMMASRGRNMSFYN